MSRKNTYCYPVGATGGCFHSNFLTRDNRVAETAPDLPIMTALGAHEMTCFFSSRNTTRVLDNPHIFFLAVIRNYKSCFIMLVHRAIWVVLALPLLIHGAQQEPDKEVSVFSSVCPRYKI